MNTQNQFTHLEQETLVLAASKGDLDAFNQLVLAYQDMVYNHAFALLGDHAKAEDAAQESFIKAFQNIGYFRGGSFRSWLLKIVTNSAYDMMRKFQRHPTQPLFPEDENGEEIESVSWLADPTASVQDHVEQNEFSKGIYKLIGELPDVYRTVLTLVDLYEMDYAEAAETLKVPIGTVKSRLARARLQMKRLLHKDLGCPLPSNPADLVAVA